MQCTSCKNAAATIHVLDLEKGAVVESHYLCENCAATKEITQKSIFSSQVLQSLLGGAESRPGEAATGAVCPGCHLTAAEFKLRGRLGCPRCYDVFRPALMPLLERYHDAVTHQGRFPGRTANPAPQPVSLAELRTRLHDAILEERYEEAAKLRDELKRVADGDDGSAES